MTQTDDPLGAFVFADGFCVSTVTSPPVGLAGSSFRLKDVLPSICAAISLVLPISDGTISVPRVAALAMSWRALSADLDEK